MEVFTDGAAVVVLSLQVVRCSSDSLHLIIVSVCFHR